MDAINSVSSWIQTPGLQAHQETKTQPYDQATRAHSYTKQDLTATVLQIRRGSRDNLGIISHISP